VFVGVLTATTEVEGKYLALYEGNDDDYDVHLPGICLPHMTREELPQSYIDEVATAELFGSQSSDPDEGGDEGEDEGDDEGEDEG
jgi:hypothetical protein